MATTAQVSIDALYDSYLDIIQQPPVRSSERVEVRRGRPEVWVSLSVRPCPIPGARWVVVLDSEELVITPHQTKTDAIRAYASLVRECEDDYARYGGHAWTRTDVHGVPTLPNPAA